MAFDPSCHRVLFEKGSVRRYRHCLHQIAELHSESIYSKSYVAFVHATKISDTPKPENNCVRATRIYPGEFDAFSIQAYGKTTQIELINERNRLLACFPSRPSSLLPGQVRIPYNTARTAANELIMKMIESDIANFEMLFTVNEPLIFKKMLQDEFFKVNGGLNRAIKFALRLYPESLACTDFVIISLQASYLLANGFFRDFPAPSSSSPEILKAYLNSIFETDRSQNISLIGKYLPEDLWIGNDGLLPDMFIEHSRMCETRSLCREAKLTISPSVAEGFCVKSEACDDLDPYPMPRPAEPVLPFHTGLVAVKEHEPRCCIIS
jgi:hypothetical protein